MKRLLIVDDDKNLRLLYQDEFSEAGYEVILAEDGKEAIEKLEYVNPDAVIMDIRMPKMDGIEALGRMVRKAKDIPIILHTAYKSYKDNFMTWGAEAFVLKSSSLDELKKTVSTVLEKAGKRDNPKART